MAILLGALLVVVGALLLWSAWAGSQRPAGSVRVREAAAGVGVAGAVLCLGGLAVAILGLDNVIGVVALVVGAVIALGALVMATISAGRGATST